MPWYKSVTSLDSVSKGFTQPWATGPRCINPVETSTSWCNLYMSLLMLNESEIAHNNICIFRACHHDLNQNSGKHGYIPRSIKLRNNKAPSISVDVQKCNVTGWSNQADIKSIASTKLDDAPSGMAFNISDLLINLYLCTQNYYRLYNHQHQKPIQCATCNELSEPSLSESYSNWTGTVRIQQ